MLGNLLWKVFGNRFGAVVLGVGLLAIGVFGLDDSEVTCGSQVMSSADKCVTTSNGSSTTRSYEEERVVQRRYQIAFIAVGGVLLAGGTVAIVVRAVRRGTGATAVPGGPSTG